MTWHTLQTRELRPVPWFILSDDRSWGVVWMFSVLHSYRKAALVIFDSRN